MTIKERIKSLKERIDNWDDDELTDLGIDFRVLIEHIEALEQEVSRLRGLLDGKSILEDCTLLRRDEKPLFRFPADADGHCFVNLSNYTFVPSELLQDGQAGRWSEKLWGGDDAE